ncbi:Zn-dependent hydrolase [Acuticoccus sp.]|uniref:Zn-dependent hydrolase n=1 Tax=Acuticoccus sp. TaxID=1904378 RepID=UPI003B515A95
MSDVASLRVDGDRFWDTVMRSAAIGPGVAGGLSRLALTDADRDVRRLFGALVDEAGLTLTVDKLGNMFARYEGREDLPPVVAGSHLDTQVAGGRFDGIVGVMGALEAVRTLADAGVRPRRPIVVVNWSNEEGARFPPPMSASAVFAGLQGLEWGLSRVDRDARTFGEELARIGYAGDDKVGFPIDACFELHIEQGPRLDAEGVPVGIVTGGAPTRGLKLEVRGEHAHAGPTPMLKRRNALVAAARVIVALDDIGWRHAPAGKTTSARLDVSPNLSGIISNEAALWCDMRHPEAATVEGMLAEFERAVEAVADASRCDVEVVERWCFGGDIFDDGCVALLREAADRLGHAHLDLLSEAGHDAYNIATVAPTAMVFCPCRDGITHNEAEHCDKATTIPAVDVLLHAVLARADR